MKVLIASTSILSNELDTLKLTSSNSVNSTPLSDSTRRVCIQYTCKSKSGSASNSGFLMLLLEHQVKVNSTLAGVANLGLYPYDCAIDKHVFLFLQIVKVFL